MGKDHYDVCHIPLWNCRTDMLLDHQTVAVGYISILGMEDGTIKCPQCGFKLEKQSHDQ